MNPRRELLAAVVLCLMGSALVLLAVSQAWVSAKVPAPPPLPSRRLELRGYHFAEGARALGFVGLAGVAALLAARDIGRLLVGLLIAAAGVGIVAVVVRALADTAGLGAWPYVAIVGGVLLVAAGGLVVARGRSWTSMSARYDAPAQKPRGEASLWEALDRGEDPTDETRSRAD